MIWTPVIEEDFGQERFLTEHPMKLVTSGQFLKVPVLIGASEYEFGYIAFSIYIKIISKQLSTIFF